MNALDSDRRSRHVPKWDPGILRWRLFKGARRLRQRFCGACYRDEDSDTRNSILVAGTGRSGTTWLAGIIASQLRCRMMFEPFYPAKVEAYRSFHYFQYMRPDERNDRLYAFCETILSGSIRNAWIDSQIEYLRPRCRIVKEIRANLFLRWIHDRFPEIPILFVIRHPCAVVQSRMSLNWATDGDIRPFVLQDKLVKDFLSDKMDIIERATTPEEKHAIVWCVSNLVPLRQFEGHALNVVFYEDLCLRPDEEIRKIFKMIGHSATDGAIRHALRPSATVTRGSSIVSGESNITAWSTRMTAAQRDVVLRTVEAFGLHHLYGSSSVPQVPRHTMNQ